MIKNIKLVALLFVCVAFQAQLFGAVEQEVGESDQVARLKAEKEKLKIAIRAVQAECEKLKKDVCEAERYEEQAKKRNKKLDAELKELRPLLAKEVVEAYRLRGEKADLKRQNRRLRDALLTHAMEAAEAFRQEREERYKNFEHNYYRSMQNSYGAVAGKRGADVDGRQSKRSRLK